MALKRIKKYLFGAPRITPAYALDVYKRDHFTCQYCGLNGLQSYENWLILTIDHVHPHARGGSRSMENLVTACQPCNIIKGKRPFKSREDARKYVLGKREEWRKVYQEQAKAAGAHGGSH